MRATIHEQLRDWFADRLGTQVELGDFVHHAEGFSWQTYTLSVTADGGAPRGFALRCEPPDGVLAPYDLAGQYALHGELLEHQVAPVPERFWLETDASVIGMPFYVMARMPGRVPNPLDREPFAPELHETMRQQFIGILCNIHRADWRALPSIASSAVETDPRANALAQIDRWRSFYEGAAPRPVGAVELALAWLEANVAVSGRLVLCHGDYRLGNVMVDGSTINAVFDWELAHVSDPVEDLAWAALTAFRGRAKQLVAHLMSPADFLDRYGAESGVEISPECFRFWTVLGHLKAIAIYLRGARAFEDGRTRDLRMAVVGNRTVQLIADLLEDLP